MAECPVDKVPPPSLGDLAKLKVSDWYKVGKILGFQEYDLQKIHHQQQQNTHIPHAHACQVAMFGKWLREHPSPSVQDVIVALRKAKESGAADELSRKYGEENAEKALIPLPEPKQSITSNNIVATGPEKSGRQAILNIVDDIVEENVSEEINLIQKYRHFLKQNQWAHFLSLLNYHLPAVRFRNAVNMGEVPEVMEMAPVLLRGSFFHFICFDLTQDMTKPVETTVNVGKHQSTRYTSWQSVKQYVHRTVETLTATNLPLSHSFKQAFRQRRTIAIVGIHSGENWQVSTKLERVDADLRKMIESSGITKAVRYCHQENRMIFSLDLFRSQDKTHVKDELKQVMDRKMMDYLELDRNAYNLISLLHFRGGVLNLSECKYVARLCGVRESDLTTLLKKIHDKLGLILHFQQVPKMKNLVICESNYLIDPLESFCAIALSGTSKCPQDPSAIRKTGEISLSLIDDIKSREEPGDKVTVSCLLELLKYYKFLSEAEGADGTMVYFMPCLIQPHPLLGSKCNEEQIASLLFCFKSEHSPHLLFTALMAQLARNWKLARDTRYNNCVTFIVNNYSLTKITLKDKGDYFELSAGIGLPDQEYSHIRQEVQRALHLIKIRYTHLSSVVCRVGFYCPHSVQSRSPHGALVDVVNDEGFLQCLARRCRKGRNRTPLSEKMKIWFSGEKQLNERSVDGFVNLLADISLSSDIDEEDILQQVEAHIVEEGSISLRVVRCGLFGAPGVGKTSSMKRLTNEIENLKEMPFLPSTGIEPPITIPLYSTTKQLPVLIADQEWNPQDLDSQLQTILQCIITNDDGSPLPGLVTTADPPATGQTGSLSAPIKPSAFLTQPNPSTSYSNPSPVSSQGIILKPETSCSPTTTDLKLPPFGQKFDPCYIRNLIKQKSWMKMRNILEEFEDVTLLNIVDTGGQPEYQDILPAILGGSGLSLLFFNLMQDPEKTYPVVYRHTEEGTQSREYHSNISTLEMLFQVLATLTDTASEQHAAILVGTHLDQLMVRNEVDSFERKVVNALKETEFHKKDVIKSFQAFGEERIVFPLDNMTGSQAEIKQLQRIINKVTEHFQCKLLPTSWLLFHLALRYQYEKKPGYCTMEQCKLLAARCGINEKDVPRVLSYFHKNFGTILYFPDVPCLREVVICNPSIIFTAINSLVAESFTNNPLNPQISNNIRETGEIARTIIDRICASDTAGGTLPTYHIIELLKYHHLITEIQSTDPSEGMVLFMPCLLHYCDEQETLKMLHELNPAPLFIHFSCGYIPNGFFTGYIVGLAEEWILEPKRYKNRVSFVIDKALVVRCTLTLHYNHIQVQVQAPLKENNKVCIRIRQTLLSVIDAMRKKFAYIKGIKPQLRLLCPASIDSKYFATCLDQESPEKMHCVACDSHVLLPKHKIWFSSFKKDDADEPMCTEEIQPTTSEPHTPSVSSIQKDSFHTRIRNQTGSHISHQSARAISDAERMDVCDANNETVVASSKLSEALISQTKCHVDVAVQVDDLRSIEKAKLSVDVAVQVDDLRSIEKAKLSVDVAVQVDELRSIEKAKLSVGVAVQVDDLRSIGKLSQHDLGRPAEANYCDLEASQAAENKEEQQQMLKRIERAKDVQIFNLEKLIQKSHVDTIETNQELQFINDENQQLQHKLATMLQISNAKDWQIAQLEYKLHSQLLMLSSQSDYQGNSKEPQCYVSTIDSAVQADYLAIAPDFLRSVEVYGETVLEVVGDKPQKLEWPGHGFYIEVPEGALSPGVTASVAVKIILSGQFILPENSRLISPVYWISSTIKFEKEVAVNIQHCAVIRNGEHCSKFKFIIARCSQKELPYRFREREGLFNLHTQYAAIKLKQFSMIGETGPVDTEIRCIGFMYYKQRSSIPLIADFQFLVVMDHEVYLKKVKEEYGDWSLDNNCLEICLSDADIELDQQEQKVKSWQILPLTDPPKILKNAVTKFEPGKTIPHCAFELQLLPGKEYQRLLHKVNLKGVAHPESFHIRYPQINEVVSSPPLTGADSSNGQLQIKLIKVSKSPMVRASNPVDDKLSKLFKQLEIADLKDVIKYVFELDVSQFKQLGLQLGLLLPTLKRIADCTKPEDYGMEVIAEWLKQVDNAEPTWNNLAKALDERTVKGHLQAKQIREDLLTQDSARN